MALTFEGEVCAMILTKQGAAMPVGNASGSAGVDNDAEVFGEIEVCGMILTGGGDAGAFEEKGEVCAMTLT